MTELYIREFYKRLRYIAKFELKSKVRLFLKKFEIGSTFYWIFRQKRLKNTLRRWSALVL